MNSRISAPKNARTRTPRTALVAVGYTLLLLLASAPQAASADTGLPPLGMSIDSIAPLEAGGAAPRYGSYWVGDWMADSGWGGFDKAMAKARAAGVTPVVYWYYWGDSISPSCVDNGCGGRSRSEWNALTDQLVSHLRTTLDGAEVLIVLENEFNKAGISGSYAPTFDAHLEGIAKKLNTVSGAKLILGFGNWGENDWTKFPKSAAQSEYIGFQMMRASTKDTETSYRAAADRTVYLTNHITTKFNKPSFLYDVALSSYPDAKWANIQAETLDAIFAGLRSSGATGLQGIVYRSLNDHYMSPANYYGYAESHWGLKTQAGESKPAYGVWLKYAKASSTPAQPPAPAPENTPGAFEAEDMRATKGGRGTSSAASGGAYWNLWSNGEVYTTLVSDAGYSGRITVVANGQPAGGVAPTMEVRLNETLLATFSVVQGFGSYTADVDLPAGISMLRIVYTNDAIVNGADRNLLVDLATVGPRPVNQPPSASFAHEQEGLTTRFDASASSDPEGSALSYAWDFGDGMTGTGVAPRHAYEAAGAYRVVLTVSDGAREADATAEITAIQPNRAPTARITVAGEMDTYEFNASGSTDPDADALTFAWDFGDGMGATGARASHTYAQAGTYQASVRVTDARGLASNASSAVTVSKPVPPPAPAPQPAPTPFSANFSGVEGNNYWVEVDVAGNKPLAGVCATVNGSACQPLTLRNYGWAASFHVPNYAKVVFRASASSGESVTSGAYLWPSATPVSSTPAPAPEKAKATFAPYDGNEYWVQTRIASDQGVKSVCASLDGGACKPLSLRSWGAYAAGMKAPTGTKVVFSATLADGSVVKSATYTWPVK